MWAVAAKREGLFELSFGVLWSLYREDRYPGREQEAEKGIGHTHHYQWNEDVIS